jgi:phospholipid-translocating ATPase
MGFRTLVIAQRQMSRKELDSCISRLKAARRLVENRDEVMRQIYRDIESHLDILGATGVEDQLQEGVVETLHALGAAGIHVWVLTGDKIETATAVAYACGLMTSSSKQLMLVKYAESEKEQMAVRLKEMQDEMIDDDNNVLVIDGETIEVALKHYPQLLCDVSMKVFRVICCRMTPLQKSQVVRMVKNTPRRPITAAVGDGANDVAMIQEAHIGIGKFYIKIRF